jgi:hypothetical protein
MILVPSQMANGYSIPGIAKCLRAGRKGAQKLFADRGLKALSAFLATSVEGSESCLSRAQKASAIACGSPLMMPPCVTKNAVSKFYCRQATT